MVDGSGLENNSFSIVTIDEKQIRIDGYKRASDEGFGLY
jgi:alkaline phosphatase